MNTDALAAEQAPMQNLFEQYSAPQNVYDEMFAGRGVLRDGWQAFFDALRGLQTGEFSRRWDQAQRLLQENGAAYSAYGDPQGKPRPWQLDPLPLLIPYVQWQPVAAALQQRARLLNLVLADLYGPQLLLQEGVLPAEFVFSHPGFRRPLHGQSPPGGVFLHLYAADLARSPDGRWWVLADRTEAPSGAGYALENRIVISRILPHVFRRCRVERLAPFFIALQETQRRLAPSHRENPRVILLTQGPQSPNYFEDAYLARYLGYTLAEGGDLAVRNNRVTLKTLGGLLPVDVVVRRPDSEDCDPVELPGQSHQGVSGLLQSSRAGNVFVSNALGSGLVESPVLMAYLPALCRKLLGEELRLPGAATWWCGDAASREHVLKHLDRLIVMPAFRRRVGSRNDRHKLSETPPPQLAQMIQADPSSFVAQERVIRSSAPVWSAGAVTPAHIALRAYLAAAGDSYEVMQGGLVRTSASVDSLELSLLSGEGSKDAWVLAEGPVSQVSLLQNPDQAIQLRRSGAELPSRVADHMYWLGRRLERAESAARLLRCTATRLAGETETDALPELPVLLRALAAQGQIEPGFVVEGIRQQLPQIEHALPSFVFDENQRGSLRWILSEMFRFASIVRDRMSADSWSILHRIDQQFHPYEFDATLADLLNRTDELIIQLSAFSGIVTESMTRTLAFRFLELGRRLERGLQMTLLIKNALIGAGEVRNAILEAVLETADSLMTYRSRYLANLQLAAVLDLLLTDETNPRSVARQLVQLGEHVDALPRRAGQVEFSAPQRLAMAMLHNIRMIDIHEIAQLHSLGEQARLEHLVHELETKLPQLSDAISHEYLIHVGPRKQLSEIRPSVDAGL